MDLGNNHKSMIHLKHSEILKIGETWKKPYKKNIENWNYSFIHSNSSVKACNKYSIIILNFYLVVPLRKVESFYVLDLENVVTRALELIWLKK